MRVTLVVVVASCLLLAACQPQEPGPTPEQIAAERVSQAMQAGADDGSGQLPQVEIAPEGSRFDPPVRITQLPSGTWYCDLGTVHYARPDVGEGRCPVCGMALSRR